MNIDCMGNCHPENTNVDRCDYRCSKIFYNFLAKMVQCFPLLLMQINDEQETFDIYGYKLYNVEN